MSINNALAGIAVRDLRTAIPWYEKLFGRKADSHPMDQVAEWKFPRGGLLQVFQDVSRAGSSSVTLAVNDIEDEVDQLDRQGTQISQKSVSTSVRTATVQDPDGNQIVFAEARGEWTR